jgi:hypothetical protein
MKKRITIFANPIFVALAVYACSTDRSTETVSNETVVNVYNWADYIAPDTIEKFEAEYGVKVNYDTYDSSEVIDVKILAGNGASRGDRARNVQGAFRALSACPSVLLIDDVRTSGATLAEASRALRDAGCPQVRCLCLAAAPS